jgi:hypothetical protein
MKNILNADHKWIQIAILMIYYLEVSNMSKQKLVELLYLIYKELKKTIPLIDLNFYLNIKTNEIEITTSTKDIKIEDILNELISEEFLDELSSSEIYCTYFGEKLLKLIMDDPKYEYQINTIIKVIVQYEDLSEKGLINLILENLKHS